ncbi:hypothetical protein ACJIZ3_023343 [Penstemon smallii]|uniref:Uncharacterized protein n=1 Tax=Penstemon smallii TaxID=265156 RepID=A0ABD3TPR7_9LAMI
MEKICESYEGAWICYSEVPQDVKEMWFNKFNDKYRWNQENERAIRRISKMKARKELFDRLYKQRVEKKFQRPNWIGVGYWDIMVHRWKTDPKFIASSQKNKQNRASDCDGMGFPLYAGGSKSQLCHSDDIEKNTGAKPSRADVFMITHSKVVNGQREWVDKRSEFVHENFVDIISSQDSTELSVVDPQTELETWIDVVGPPNKKGRCYGLAVEAKFVKGGSSRGLSQSQQPPVEVINEIFSLKSQCHTYAEEIGKLKEASDMLEKAYEEKINTIRGDMDSMMQQWQMMLARGNMFHQQPVAPFNPSLTGQFQTSVAGSQSSYYMSSPMFGYMGNMAPLPHQSTHTPAQVQSSPHAQSSPHEPQDVTRPLSQEPNDQDSIRMFTLFRNNFTLVFDVKVVWEQFYFSFMIILN